MARRLTVRLGLAGRPARLDAQDPSPLHWHSIPHGYRAILVALQGVTGTLVLCQ